jgi:hypothetical protein
MKTNLKRRDFIKKSATACMGCCALMASSQLSAVKYLFMDGEKPDPKKLNYCGYTCPEDCQFKTASVENDLEKKKEAWANWRIKERYGLDFDEKTAFCFGCKKEEKPAGVVMTNCTVRSCAIEKGFDCCIECEELKTCNKDLWSRFPKFHEKVVEMQTVFLEG